MIVGEAPTGRDVEKRTPFSGSSGKELSEMLFEAGIDETDCFFTYVCRVQPPYGMIDNFFPKKTEAKKVGAVWFRGRYCTHEIIDGLTILEEEIKEVKPDIIIGLGNTPLWGLTGNLGIMKWRGSQMRGELDDISFNFIPTYSPIQVMRQYSWRWIAVHDLKRVRSFLERPETWERPLYKFVLRPSYKDAVDYLDVLLHRAEQGTVNIAVDIETRLKQIACVGIADSIRTAICIPILCVEDPSGYWSEDEELELYIKLRDVLTHKNVRVAGQNYLYDQQYFARRMGFKSNYDEDTMAKHQVCFPGTKKSLDFISSLYCAWYQYWKGEGKEWNPREHNEEQLWNYNCLDACNTLECSLELDKIIKAFRKEEQYRIQMMDAHHAFRLMLRGIRVDFKAKTQMGLELVEAIAQRNDFIHYVLGIPLNCNSPKQVQMLLYDVMKLPPQKKRRKTKEGMRYTPTGDADAIDKLMPLADIIYRPVLKCISEVRSLNTYKSTFAEARVDADGRLRCSINVAGPETFRWSTSEDAFGYGMNLQNIPRNRED